MLYKCVFIFFHIRLGDQHVQQQSSQAFKNRVKHLKQVRVNPGWQNKFLKLQTEQIIALIQNPFDNPYLCACRMDLSSPTEQGQVVDAAYDEIFPMPGRLVCSLYI